MTQSLTLAISELRALITKAARGAGLDWGLAEEAGWAAEWLARRGMPAADWATDWLAARIDGATSPVEVGTLWADEGGNSAALQGRALPDGLSAPGYLLPFLHRLAPDNAGIMVSSPLGHVASVSAAGWVEFGPCWGARPCGWTVALSEADAPEDAIIPRPQVSMSVMECLEGLALRTTVPQSQASRLDAGSATGDND